MHSSAAAQARGARAHRLAALLTAVVGCAPALGEEMVFSDYGTQSSSLEILHRLLSPLAAQLLERRLSASSQHLDAQPVDLAAERFTVHVPPQAPPQGYALLVFIQPWKEALLPAGWPGVFDRYGMIYVSAARSGNDADVLTRRVPLALLAAHNLMQRYPVDAARVYIGGFSGGSRVALRLALAYPELFRGALLNSGSDPMDAGPPSPPALEALRQLQEGSRFIYVTGERDTDNLSLDVASQQSLRRWCVFDFDSQVMAHAGHQELDAQSLTRALAGLTRHTAPDSSKLAACRTQLAERIEGQLDEVAALLVSDRRSEAQKRLLEADRHLGGAATPRSLELEEALGWEVPAGH
jgi:predicted esterase